MFILCARAAQYELAITVTGNGTTDPSPGTSLHLNGTLVNVTAIDPDYTTFDHWLLDDVNVSDANNYTVTMDQNHTLQAVFITQYELAITVTGNGTTDPSPGTSLHLNGTLVNVTAIDPVYVEIVGVPRSIFDHWLLDDVDVGDAINYTVTMDQNHTLQAVFTFSYLPVANADGPYSGNVNVTIVFDGTGSADSDGTITSYSWTFGDGGTGTGVSPNHTYTDAGIYTVTLTVTNDGGLTDSDTANVTVVELLPDTGTLSITTNPVNGTVFVNSISWGVAPQSQAVEMGAYTVSFEAVTGYTTPASQTAVVTADANTTITGTYALIPPPQPAEFEFSDLRIFYPGVNPPEVKSGQTVTVTVSIEAENVGDLEGSRTVELMVDGEVVDSKEVTLDGGASETALFELTRGRGNYEVEVEGFTESFAVVLKPSIIDLIPGFPYDSIIIGLVTAVFMLWMLSRRK